MTSEACRNCSRHKAAARVQRDRCKAASRRCRTGIAALNPHGESQLQNSQSSTLTQTGAQAPTTRRRASRWWKAALAVGLVALAPAALAGPYKVFGNHYAWVNNFNDPNNIIQARSAPAARPS
ncbi:hypothetical protein XPN_2864 [Xanthomonas arboricola pv. pruni MAFF 301427]|nr:hypothetical protein XPN_2864 [Xanthomonas arboricola pv. pruni MAFF 301427]